MVSLLVFIAGMGEEDKLFLGTVAPEELSKEDFYKVLHEYMESKG
jgi:hypothetical protein